jgi:hypothetical protein
VRGRRPTEYEAICGLPRLSGASVREWERELWELVKLNNSGLRARLQERGKRVEGRLSRYRKDFRRHLRKVAEAVGG